MRDRWAIGVGLFLAGCVPGEMPLDGPGPGAGAQDDLPDPFRPDTGLDVDPLQGCLPTAGPVLDLGVVSSHSLGDAGWPLDEPERGLGLVDLGDGTMVAWMHTALACIPAAYSLPGACPSDSRARTFLSWIEDGRTVAVGEVLGEGRLGTVVPWGRGRVLGLATESGISASAGAVTLARRGRGVGVEALAPMSGPITNDRTLDWRGADRAIRPHALRDGRVVWGGTIQDLDPTADAGQTCRVAVPDGGWIGRSWVAGDGTVRAQVRFSDTHSWGSGWTSAWGTVDVAACAVVDLVDASVAPGLRGAMGAPGGIPATGDLLAVHADGMAAVESTIDTSGRPVRSAMVRRDDRYDPVWSTDVLFEGPVLGMHAHPEGGWVLVGDDARGPHDDATPRAARVLEDGTVAWRRALPTIGEVLASELDDTGRLHLLTSETTGSSSVGITATAWRVETVALSADVCWGDAVGLP